MKKYCMYIYTEKFTCYDVNRKILNQKHSFFRNSESLFNEHKNNAYIHTFN